MEGRLWDVLDLAPAADVLNQNRPRDESLPVWDRRELDRYVAPITAVLRALGASPDTPDQAPPPARRRRVRRYSENVSDLLTGGLLRPGARLRALPETHEAVASITPQGGLEVGGHTFDTPSAAAMHVTGRPPTAGTFGAHRRGTGASFAQRTAGTPPEWTQQRPCPGGV